MITMLHRSVFPTIATTVWLLLIWKRGRGALVFPNIGWPLGAQSPPDG